MTAAGNRTGVLRGGAWSFGGKTITAACSILINATIARLLPADAFGTYVLAASLTLFGSTISCLGMHQGLVRLVSANLARNESRRIRWLVRTTLLASGLTSLTIGLVTFGMLGKTLSMSVFDAPLLAAVSLPIIAWLTLRTLQLLVAASFRGLQDLRSATVFEGALTAILTLSGLLAYRWYSGAPDLANVLTIAVLATAISSLAGLALLFLRLPQGHEKTDFATLRDLGLPLLITAGALFANAEAHVWVLAWLRPEEDVALFGAALRLVKFIAFPLLIVNAVIPPVVARLYERKRYARLQTLLQSAATLCALPLVVVLGLLVLFAAPIMVLVYGDFYANAASVLIVLAAGQSINVLTGSPGILLAMSGHQRQLMWISMVSGVSGIILTGVFALRFGAMGAALGAAGGMITHNVTMWWFARSRLNIRTGMNPRTLPFLYYEARGRLGRASQSSAALRNLDRYLSRIDKAVWRMRGRTVIECLGDSHSTIFRDLNRERAIPSLRFNVTAVRGATAFGIANPNSRTNAYQIFGATLAGLGREQPLLFMLGEVDLGFIIWMRAAESGQRVEDVMQEAIGRYTAFLNEQRQHFDQIIVCSAPLPTIGDGPPTGEVARLRAAVTASQRERTDVTLRYNDLLRQWCDTNDCLYLDLDKQSLDSATQLVKTSLSKANASDHHYDRETFTAVLKSAFADARIVAALNQD